MKEKFYKELSAATDEELDAICEGDEFARDWRLVMTPEQMLYGDIAHPVRAERNARQLLKESYLSGMALFVVRQKEEWINV